ncbi:tyrosine-type recombinase/integrase [Pseudotabrizicola formosa]|uniref:tyrosine-type recombinase/integrase n=1 Tax=Pseudotabrizicola formosa TaxID=2030009 RepID=UPI000CD0EAF6|nr:site-specific integrase [Pseudotabrizicola formosa]
MPSKRYMNAGLFRRGTGWSLRRNVPKRYAGIETRTEIWMALSARSEAAARKEAEGHWRRLLSEWENRLKDQPVPFEMSRRKMGEYARKLGFSYVSAENVAKLPTDEFERRTDFVMASEANGLDMMTTATAILGGLKSPQKLSHVLAAFYESERIAHLHMSSAQLRQYRNSYNLPIHRLINHFGDIDIQQISEQDFAEVVYEIWPNEGDSGIQPRTVNGRLYRLRKIFRTAKFFHGTKLPFDVQTFIARQSPGLGRPYFSTEWIRDRILAPGSLSGLDSAHRCIMLALIDTGMRIMEAANLMPDEILLDGPIPYLHLQGAFRPLKTKNAYRMIPLTKVSLEAFQAHRQGFPTLRDDAGLSGRLNRYLTKAGLRETPHHTLHSFRHAYSMRLARAGVNESMIAELMGHKSARGYGRGSPLELRHKYAILAAI